MRSHLLSLSVLILLLPAIYLGCSKDDYLPGLTGNMIGYIYTFDEFGSLLGDRSHVKITALGMDESYSTHSNSKGRFVLEDIPTGTYELHFEKEGFGVLKQFGVQHLGGKPTILLNNRSEEQAYILYEMPATIIDHLNIVNDSISCEFTFAIANPPSSFLLKAYFSSSDNFTRQNAAYIENVRIWQTDGKYWGKFYFNETPFSPGETVYYKACRFTANSVFRPPMQNWNVVGVDTYFDYELNETIYPNLGDESDEYSFIFPE
ncbi:MAG: carboxypeptidase regulatory-like domain-containing protein [Bacteroidales bacterium]|nr:carboxypeptidase regulatory-like domain-containing protein [Bacteroidales bacterium]